MDEIKHELDNDDAMQIIKAVKKNYKPTNIRTLTKETKSIAKSIKEIIDNSHERKWLFPVFQRDYAWGQSRVKSLLESILLDNFIGSFLMWKIKNKKDLPFETRDIGEKEYNDTINAIGIILDGKQRITSLYKVLKEKDPKFPYYYVNFLSLANRYIPDKKKIQPDIIITTKKELNDDYMYKNFYFPLYKISQYKEWCDKLKDYHEEDQDISYFIDNFIEEKLRHFWEDPIVPVISLHEHIRSESVPMIFELINTKGLKLNTFDILVAHLAHRSQFSIELRPVWNNLLDNNLEIKRGYKIFKQDLPLSIIQAMHLYYSGGKLSPSEKNILNMFDKRYRHDSSKFDSSKFYKEWNDFVEITREAIRKFTTKYGVLNEKFLPATSLLPPLIANLKRAREIKTNIPTAYDKIDTWYWSAVFSGEYKAGTTTVMAKDAEVVKNWLETNKLPRENVITKARSMWSDKKESINRLKELNPKSAMYKGVLSLLVLKDPQDFFTSEGYTSRAENDADKDHIFPEDMFKENNNKYKKKIPKELREYADSVINKTILSIRGNRGLKSDSPPSDIVKELIKEYKSKPQKLKDILDSHLITKEAFQAMKDDNFEAFLDARGKAILEEIIKRIMPPQNLTQPRNTTQPNKNDTNRDDQNRARQTQPNKTEHNP